MIEPNCPCVGCFRRHAKCHARCSDYAAYNESRDKYREELKRIRDAVYVANGIIHNPKNKYQYMRRHKK